MKDIIISRLKGAALGTSALCLMGSVALADQVILDDLIVDGSACIGIDCVNGESFGFDTLRLKENNLRIKAADTSTTASFPTNDWQITFNNSANGGAEKFSIDDVGGGRTPFTITAGAPSHSVFVSSSGRLGLKTNTPAVDIHSKSGNTPTLRLEQDGSSGFSAQTWDIAGNEANFFVRDATNGSALPFRVFPGAPSNSLTIEGTTGDIGVGTTAPTSSLHVKRNTGGFLKALTLENNAAVALILDNNAAISPSEWRMGTIPGNTDLVIVTPDAAGDEFKLSTGGNLTINGNYFANGGTQLNVPDYVFADDYQLMPLAEVRAFIEENSHLPRIPSASEISETGLNMTQMQMSLLEKVEELTLYTLQQEETIAALQARVDQIDK